MAIWVASVAERLQIGVISCVFYLMEKSMLRCGSFPLIVGPARFQGEASATVMLCADTLPLIELILRNGKALIRSCKSCLIVRTAVVSKLLCFYLPIVGGAVPNARAFARKFASAEITAPVKPKLCHRRLRRGLLAVGMGGRWDMALGTWGDGRQPSGVELFWRGMGHAIETCARVRQQLLQAGKAFGKYILGLKHLGEACA